ncbi:MAG: Trp biosynthesis-associated membrane protein [Micrococcales bacterium]|nr:Trp biosynthesis-associated membrane protein [Micrococcales bacterium]
MSRLGRKSSVVLLGLLGAGLLIASGGREWITGTVSDAVLGASEVAAKGTEAAPGIVAVAVVSLAAVIATVTSAGVVRRLTRALLLGAAMGAVGLAVRSVLSADTVLGSVSAKAVGRTGSLETHASVTAWPWLALLGGLLLLLATAGAALGSREWASLGSRYDSPTEAGPRGERTGTDWDRLSAGEDPTDDGGDDTPPHESGGPAAR